MFQALRWKWYPTTAKKPFCDMSSYYQVLGCEKNASQDELKKAYQGQVRKFHPDKNRLESSEDFLLLDKAWKTLRNPETRKAYDESLARKEFSDAPLYCQVEASEMTCEPCGILTYPCRCGGVYQVTETDLGSTDQLKVSCDECSFHIVISKSWCLFCCSEYEALFDFIFAVGF